MDDDERRKTKTALPGSSLPRLTLWSRRYDQTFDLFQAGRRSCFSGGVCGGQGGKMREIQGNTRAGQVRSFCPVSGSNRDGWAALWRKVVDLRGRPSTCELVSWLSLETGTERQPKETEAPSTYFLDEAEDNYSKGVLQTRTLGNYGALAREGQGQRPVGGSSRKAELHLDEHSIRSERLGGRSPPLSEVFSATRWAGRGESYAATGAERA